MDTLTQFIHNLQQLFAPLADIFSHTTSTTTSSGRSTSTIAGTANGNLLTDLRVILVQIIKIILWAIGLLRLLLLQVQGWLS